MALSSTNRKTRGLSFPFCGFGVTEPISINPKPNLDRLGTASPSLSNPAANPIGFENSMFQTFVFYVVKIITHTQNNKNTNCNLLNYQGH